MRFTQVKIATRQPERLARFYTDALGCEVVLPLTTLEEPAATGVGSRGAEVRILVLRLPGQGDATTLELISIDGDNQATRSMLTFYVDDVAKAANEVVAAGGSFGGEIVEFRGPSGSMFRFVFMHDPEENVIDLYAKIDD